MAAGTVRDEAEQAGYVREMLGGYDEAGVEAAFVYTFSRRDLPTLGEREQEPERDFDVVGEFGLARESRRASSGQKD